MKPVPSDETSVSGMYPTIAADPYWAAHQMHMDRYQSYVNNFRRAITPYLRGGIGLMTRVIPVRDGSGIVSFRFGKDLPNIDMYSTTKIDIDDALREAHTRPAAHVPTIAGSFDDAGLGFHETPGAFSTPWEDPPLASKVDSRQWHRFEREVRALEPEQTAFLLAPDVIVIAKSKDASSAWGDEAAKEDVGAILRK